MITIPYWLFWIFVCLSAPMALIIIGIIAALITLVCGYLIDCIAKKYLDKEKDDLE